MQKFLFGILRAFAKAILAQHRPLVVAVTGSVGKTSTKNAIVATLAEKWRVRGAEKNYNNELGVPLTIIGAPAPGRSSAKWLGILYKGLRLLCVKDAHYPEVLVLEFGADHPGDISHLLSFVQPRVGVLTAIGEAHMEFFGSVEAIVREKGELLAALPAHGVAVVNGDDERAVTAFAKTSARRVTYGFATPTDVRGIEQAISYDSKGKPCGMAMKIVYGGATVPIFVAGALGFTHLSAALAAAAVGIGMGMNLVEIGEGLKKYSPPPGRMRILPGIKHTVIIDDTYNASPRAVYAALDALKYVTVGSVARRWACLGDLLELGRYTEGAHREIGRKVAELGLDMLITVGERSKFIADEAVRAGLAEDRILRFNTPEDAGKFIQSEIRENDIILVKGSRGTQMEKVVLEIMAEPHRAQELLCGQNHE